MLIAKCRVLESRSMTPTVHHIRIERPAGFDFAPVQFCGLELDTDEGPEEYSMSLASSPTRPYLEFGARISSSPWKRAFQALKPGDIVEIDGPYGHFVLDERRDAVFLAGGIGITPLKGMLEYATDQSLPIRCILLYSNRTESEIAYREELETLAAKNPRIRILHTLTRPEGEPWSGKTGRIDVPMLRNAVEGLRDPGFYVCGRPEMVRDAALMLLNRLNVPRDRIHAEQFWGYG
jgi:glycine betaine catabolism B